MQLADPELRRQLGLRDRPHRDPDVRAGRLIVADRDLHAFLFPKGSRSRRKRAAVLQRSRHPDALRVAPGRSPWDIAKERYASPTVRYHFPDGRVLRGDEVADWLRIPVGTRLELDGQKTAPSLAPELERAPVVTRGLRERLDGFAVLGIDGDTPADVAGEEVAATNTIYFFPDGLIITGAELARGKYAFLLKRAPEGTRILVGYAYGGYVKPHRRPSEICRSCWNYPSTFYRLPNGRIVPGDVVDPDRIPSGTLVFFRS